MSTFQGYAVVYVPLSDGREAMVSPASLALYRRLGFSSRVSADSNGSGRTYPRHMVNDPRPGAGRSSPVSLARTLMAQRLVKLEIEGGPPAPAKGWVIRHANGDTLDCRDSNLLCVPAKGCRNGYRAVWNVRERWALVRAGLDPNRVFAERRKEARLKYCGASSRDDIGAREHGFSPLRAGRGLSGKGGRLAMGGTH